MVKHGLPGELGESGWFGRLNAFEQQETRRQVEFKRRHWPDLPDGVWSKRPDYTYPHILPDGHLEKNLYPPYAKAILDYCHENSIAIHSEALNLRSSQACCFNLLFPLRTNLPLATMALRPLLPDGATVTTIEFEYTGPDDTTEWLGEPAGGQRGQNRTSIDAAVWWRTSLQSGLTLVEWKYTERAFGACGGYASQGNKQPQWCEQLDIGQQDPRRQCYLTQGRHRRRYWDHLSDAGIDLGVLSKVTGCPFRGPFYQLMRQFLLAAHLRRQGDLDTVEVATIGFCGNASLTKPPDELRGLGQTTFDAWNACLNSVPPLQHMNAEMIAERLRGNGADAGWVAYLLERYGV